MDDIERHDGEVTPEEAQARIIKAFDAINHNFHVIANNLPPMEEGMRYSIGRLHISTNDQFHRYLKKHYG